MSTHRLLHGALGFVMEDPFNLRHGWAGVPKVSLARGTEVTVTLAGSDGWSLIEAGEHVAWIRSSALVRIRSDSRS